MIERFLFLCLTFIPSLASTVCYFPDGTVSPNDIPCLSGGGYSTCCGSGFACLSSNICMLTNLVSGAGSGQSTYVRGSCTDKSWGDSACPQFCLNSTAGDSPHQAMGMALCPNQNAVYFCLDAQSGQGKDAAAVSAACQSYSYSFSAVPAVLTTVGYTPPRPITTTTSTSSSSPALSTSSSGSSSTSLSPTSSTTSPSAGPSHSSTDLNTGLGVGLGVGLGLIATALFTYLFLKYRKSMERNKEHGRAGIHSTDIYNSNSNEPVSQHIGFGPLEAHPASPKELYSGERGRPFPAELA